MFVCVCVCLCACLNACVHTKGRAPPPPPPPRSCETPPSLVPLLQTDLLVLGDLLGVGVRDEALVVQVALCVAAAAKERERWRAAHESQRRAHHLGRSARRLTVRNSTESHVCDALRPRLRQQPGFSSIFLRTTHLTRRPCSTSSRCRRPPRCWAAAGAPGRRDRAPWCGALRSWPRQVCANGRCVFCVTPRAHRETNSAASCAGFVERYDMCVQSLITLLCALLL